MFLCIYYNEHAQKAFQVTSENFPGNELQVSVNQSVEIPHHGKKTGPVTVQSSYSQLIVN